MKRNLGLVVVAIVTGLLAVFAAAVTAQEAEHTAPVEVTGTAAPGPCSGPSRTEVVGGISYETGQVCHPRWELSDPRLDGTVTWNDNKAQDGIVGFTYGSHSIENDGGTWRQWPVAWFEFPGATESGADHYVFDGEGEYEGLVAVLVVSGGASAAVWPVHGFIIDGAFPPPPENASTE